MSDVHILKLHSELDAGLGKKLARSLILACIQEIFYSVCLPAIFLAGFSILLALLQNIYSLF